ncbi:MAG: patatin-like phospholipase family protein [Dehalococcoidia bacterium]
MAFVLSGGGSLGSVQVGCLEALMEYAIFPDLVVGTSVGALNGVMLAKNPTRDGVRHLKDLWLSLHAHGPFRDRGVRVLMRLLLAREFLFVNNALRI